MKIKVRFEGADEIARNLKAMRAALGRKLMVRIISKELEPMAESMRSLAAWDRGQMAESVTIGTELSPAQAATNEPIAETEVYAGPGPLPQAIQEEFGNFHQGPRPFIRPSFDAHVNGAMRNVGARGIDAILSAAKKA